MTVVDVVEVPRAQYATPALSHFCVQSRPNNYGPDFVIKRLHNLTLHATTKYKHCEMQQLRVGCSIGERTCAGPATTQQTKRWTTA